MDDEIDMPGPDPKPNDLEYRDFVVDLSAADGPRRDVRVLDSPAGDARGTFECSLSREEVRRFFDESDTRTRALRFGAAPSTKAPLTALGLGQTLFDALFKGEVHDAFLRSLEVVRAGGQGLRIRIRVDPEDPDAARLHALPWELLYRADTREFLARRRRTPVERYLEVSEAGELPAVPRPLRVLVVMSSPRGLPPLDLGRERESIEKVWSRHEAVDVDFVPREGFTRASLDNLRRALLTKHYHVVHFMGHGDFDPATGRGTLYFEDEEGGADAVLGESFADELRDFGSLRLVTVNACHGAEAGDGEGRNAFSGVATALVRGGVPAVVAMQAPISDRAAIAFSRELYHRIAAGDPIDAAVTEGRRAIGRAARTDEWSKPVLFLRSRSRLFQPISGPPPARPSEWSWNPWGLVLLTVGALGSSALAGLGALLLWNDPALRDAMQVALAALAVFAGFLVRKDPRHGRRLSHLVARHKALGAGLGALGLAAVASWVLFGPTLRCASRCGALGCAPQGVRRILVSPFENLLPDDAGPGIAWTGDTADFLAMKLALVSGLQPLDVRSELTDERTRRCVDLALRGSVGQSGEDVVLKAYLSRRGGLTLDEVEVQGMPDATGETILILRNRLTLEILRVLGLDPGDALRDRILRTPTLDYEALKHNLHGVTSFLEGNNFEAMLHFERALDLDPEYADAVNNLGRLQLEQGDPEAAVKLFREATSLLPRHPSYHFNLGLALDLDGQSEEAVAALREALRLDPTHAPAYSNLGFALLELGRTQEAARVLRRGLTETRNDHLQANLYKNLGRVAFEEGDYEQGVGYFDKALERFDPYPEALFYRAMALEQLGRQEQACESWRSYGTVREHDDDLERRRVGESRVRLVCEEEAS